MGAPAPRRPAVAEVQDRQVADRLAAGDERALASVVERHGPMVARLIRRITGSPAAAEDVTQDVFIALWTRPQGFDPDQGSLRTFLAVLARRRAIDWIRRQEASRRRDAAAAIDLTGSGDDPAELAARRIDQEQVRAAVAQLPSEQRAAVELAYFGGLTRREVADALHIPEGTAKSRLRLGLARLAQFLAPVPGAMA